MHNLQLTIYLPTSQHGFKCELQRTVGRAAASSVIGIDQEKGNRETILVKLTVIVTIRNGLQTSDAGISPTDEIKTVHFPEVAREKRGTKLECSICGHGRITFPKLRTHFPGCVGDKVTQMRCAGITRPHSHSPAASAMFGEGKWSSAQFPWPR